MKNLMLILLVLLVGISCIDEPETSTTEVITENTPAALLRHVVLFKFKETATAKDIQKVEAAFVALPSKIKEIKDLEWGINNSPEELNKEFTHCFFVTFDSEEGRAVYLPHPAHVEFVELLTPHVEDVLVVDYWAK